MAPRLGSAVLMDMDGTLLDTAPDMAAALNRLRAERGLPELPYAQIRPQVSHGSLAVVRAGFPEAHGAEFEALRRRFLELYRAGLSLLTRPFDGFDVVLGRLAAARIPWGIVTNKPGWLSEPLMRAMALPHPPACLISGDTIPQRKPHPQPLLMAAARLGRRAADCVYLGDAQRDIQAALAAGMVAVGAGFGYLGAQDEPGTWGADGWIEHPLQLLDWIRLDRVKLDRVGSA